MNKYSCLRISVDIGTTKLKISCAVVSSNQILQTGNVKNVRFDGNLKPETSMLLGYHDGHLILGRDAEVMLSHGADVPDNIIQFFKLGLYPADSVANYRQITLNHLKRIQKLPEDVLADILTFSIDLVKQNLRSSTLIGDHVDNMKVELYMTVPQVSTPPDNRKLVIAAQKAGLPAVRLVYEPEAAMAFFVQKIKEGDAEYSVTELIDAKCSVCIADIGGGTMDVVTFKLEGDSSEGSRIPVRMVGEPKGYLLGSQIMINGRFRNWLLSRRTENGNRVADIEAANLGVTLEKYCALADMHFEKEKVGFLNDAPHYSFGFASQLSSEAHTFIYLPREQMERFFQEGTDEMITALDKHIQEDTAILIVPGAMGQCAFLLDCLKNKYEPRGIKILNTLGETLNPISKGALVRFSNVTARGLVSRCQFGVARTEIYDKRVHLDGIKEIRSKGRMPKLGEDKNVVFEDGYNNSRKVVHDRALWLIRKGDSVPDQGSWISLGQAEVRYIPVKSRFPLIISETIYWSDEDIPDHIAILRNGNELVNGIHEWGIIQKIVENPKLYGWRQFIDRDGEAQYQVHGTLAIKCIGANVQFAWKFNKGPGWVKLDRNENFEAEIADWKEFRQRELHTLSQEQFNPFVVSNTD